MTVQPSRRVSFPLGLGILLLPYIFVWPVLREGYGDFARKVAFGWLAVYVLALVLHKSDNTKTPAQEVTTAAIASPDAPQESIAPAPLPPIEIAPEQERANNKALIDKIQQRLSFNREKLKQNFYANTEAVEHSAEDFITLISIAASRGMSKAKEDQQQAAQAKVLALQVSVVGRQIFASAMEQTFVKTGMDARVSARGNAKDKLVVTYALMSNPLIYKFQNEVDLAAKAKGFGFKRIEYTNGFESELGKSWTVDL